MRPHPIPVAVAVLVVAAGCMSRKPDHLTDAGPAALPPGWTLAQDPETGVSIGVAGGWREGTGVLTDSPLASMPSDSSADPNSPPSNDPNAAAFNQALSRIASGVQKDLQQQDQQARAALRKKGVVINVLDGSRPTIGEERTRYYVKVIKHDSAWPLELAVADEKDRLFHPTESDIMLPVGKAHRFQTDTKLINGDEQVQIVYVLADGNNAYAIRFISTNTPNVFDQIDKQVAESFRLKHG